MFMLKVFGIIAVLALLGAGGYMLVQNSKAAAAVQQEIAQQQSEKKECEKRLTLFYQAWKKYRADHKGAEPGKLEMLVPAYISDPKLLICPTAQRWLDNHKGMDSGVITIGKQEYRETYGFQWATFGNSRSVKKQGDKAPLITCTAHEEGLYLAVFHTKPKLEAFDAAQREHYPTELRNAHPLAVRRNGTVEELASSED